MPYNDKIGSADMAGLIPVEYTDELLQKTVEQSAALRLARRLRDMPTRTRTMPVLSALPTAYFVNGEAGLKQTTKVSWENKILTAEEIAVIVPVPQDAFDDSDYPIWNEVKPLLEEAAGIVIDSAILYGTNLPTSWLSAMGSHAGLVALATAHSSAVSLANFDDVYDAVMGEAGLLHLLEEDGFLPTGHIAHINMKGLLRGARDANGQPIFNSGANLNATFAAGSLDGVPMLYPLNGVIDDSKAYDIAGQWNQLVYAFRKDITWSVSDQAIIQDGEGNIVYNLWQQDMVALRMVMRLGIALPNPINRMQQTEDNRSPFAILTA